MTWNFLPVLIFNQGVCMYIHGGVQGCSKLLLKMFKNRLLDKKLLSISNFHLNYDSNSIEHH